MSTIPTFTVSEFIATVNQVLDASFAGVTVVGEVSSFKVNQNKWVFFDLKDEESILGCFMSVHQLRMPLEDGMKVIVRGIPKMTKWGKFSLTVQSIMPIGEGSIKKSYELLKAKLKKEGLFDESRKRPLPQNLSKIGVISSTSAAGYADFIKILGERWGGLDIKVAHTQVQGMDAPDQIIRALNYFNEHGGVEIIAIIRGGGSADDLSCFNDERLVRAISASKIPVITGIGHEIDESLSDLAADLRGSTPSNVAEILSRDKKSEIIHLKSSITRLGDIILDKISQEQKIITEHKSNIAKQFMLKLSETYQKLTNIKNILNELNPDKVMSRGYAILCGKISPGENLTIITKDNQITAEIKDVAKRNY